MVKQMSAFGNNSVTYSKVEPNLKVKKWYWKNDTGHTRCYVTAGYCAEFKVLEEMFEIARKDYPDIPEKEFDVIEIIKSDHYKGFMCISFLIKGEPRDDYAWDDSC